MIMATIIDQDTVYENKPANSFIQKLKMAVHYHLVNYTEIYDTHSNNKFRYYTFFDPLRKQVIELYWSIDFLQTKISVTATYSAYRTLNLPITINNLRTKIQMSSVLRILNKNLPYYLNFILNQQNQVCVVYTGNYSTESQKSTLLKSIKSILDRILQITYSEFYCVYPYLSLTIQNYTRPQQGLKQFYESEQFNLIKLKNTFDRYRKHRDKTSDIIYQQKDINKVRRQIQESLKMFGFQLQSLANIKFTARQIRIDKLLQKIQLGQITENDQGKITTSKVDKIAYQFQIIKVQGSQKKFEIDANSQIYLGKYNFRIFKTLIEQQKQKLYKSQGPIKKGIPKFQQKDVIEERISKLVKKKPTSTLSQKALKNEINFLKFMRNQICLYIANYYLPLQNATTQLYIEHYGESLLEIINCQKNRGFLHRMDIMIKLVNGLKFIADENICHRDIKPSNIMINELNDPKIIDFGSTISAFNHKIIVSCNEKLCGTEGYYYPYDSCDQKIKYLFNRKQYETHPLFDSFSYGVIVEKIFEQQLKDAYNNQTIKNTLKYIVGKCKQHNPDNRLSYDQILCLLIILRKSFISPDKTNQIL